MSDWLGFSLNHHHPQQDSINPPAIHQHDPDSVIPINDFNPSTQTQRWRLEATDQSGPKLEDFLGGGAGAGAGADVNLNFHEYRPTEGDIVPRDGAACYNISPPPAPPYLLHYGYPYYTTTSTSTTANQNEQQNGVVSYDDGASAITQVSEIKTWLLPSSSSTGCDVSNRQECLSLAVVPAGDNRKRSVVQMKSDKSGKGEVVTRKAVDGFGQRTSRFRGVTRHRWTGRYEAHLWDNSCRKEGQTRKGRQGGYDNEEKAARAYDLAALKYWGPTTHINFPLAEYEKELEEMKNMNRQEFVANLRR
ncbi:putative transcription factor AP2-EREBP family [Helianthus annuus]|nr:putative transcription factor AP2-EREBP family [Helianthus annuus]